MARISGGVGYLRRMTRISAFAIRVSSGSCISSLYADSDLATPNAVTVGKVDVAIDYTYRTAEQYLRDKGA